MLDPTLLSNPYRNMLTPYGRRIMGSPATFEAATRNVNQSAGVAVTLSQQRASLARVMGAQAFRRPRNV